MGQCLAWFYMVVVVCVCLFFLLRVFFSWFFKHSVLNHFTWRSISACFVLFFSFSGPSQFHPWPNLVTPYVYLAITLESCISRCVVLKYTHYIAVQTQADDLLMNVLFNYCYMDIVDISESNVAWRRFYITDVYSDLRSTDGPCRCYF